MGSHALLLYVRMGVCKLCYAFHNSPRPRCSVLELAFSTAEISFSKANGRLSAYLPTVPEWPGQSRNFRPCPSGVPVVLQFMRTLRFDFHLLRWPLQSQACLV